jgi:hypothetical protein
MLKSLYRSELATYKFDLVAVQEVRWVEGGSQPADNHTLFFGNRNANNHSETGSFIHISS